MARWPASSALVVIVDSRRIGAGWADDGPQAGYFPFYIGLMHLRRRRRGSSRGSCARWAARRRRSSRAQQLRQRAVGAAAGRASTSVAI
ncbi:MAG: hypothetical protein MZW92_64435 [Comamonadaceae bacterium]|nr:hypothetical protein [Comamonadaceae bacterium]